ncbi:NADH-quinone oxidoreductase subunit NuoG [Moraxella oblonga]|uniref:NADH-quinone oxidoreductase subunit NuoG n=1 Tax=Moraxella oblonga TaxID=200413 RepID=UPI00082AE960|nr:NADH-quinone oxidoreductase subunit NuoG [Moraxella oblonga]
MAVIHIDGKSYEVDGTDNLLSACLSLGIDVPYFCYHPALGSVGSCRQCAVKQFNNEEDMKAGRGRLVMSCMVAPTNDMYISVDDTEAKEFRKRIVEYLMTNHPHDCPTCEEGGHCHLQDMTYMSGHRQRRYRFTKRTHHNQDLGAFINHEMNRCIACYRCVRFYKDYAGGTDFGVYASNNRVYFGREESGQFESEFSGNLTEVCPTGVFTDKTHSDRYNRKWDMQYAPSICQGCSTGCSISAGERYGELRRIENRYNPDVNGYFLCDKGRFGYGYVNRADRPLQPLENVNGKAINLNADVALDKAVAILKGKKVIGIGSPMASLESNFALKQLVGSDYYSTGQTAHSAKLVGEALALIRHQAVDNLSIGQIESADCVFVLGEDITQTASRVALAVRQASKNKAKSMATALRTEHWLAEPVKRIGQEAYSPIYVASVCDTKLSDIAKVPVVADINDLARLGFMVGQMIAKSPENLAQLNEHYAKFIKNLEDSNAQDDETMMSQLAGQIAYDLLVANRPLVVSGTSLSSVCLVQATGYICQNLTAKRQAIYANELAKVNAHNARLDELAKTLGEGEELKEKPLTANTNYLSKTGVYLTLPEVNSVGVAMLGGKSLEESLASDYEVAIVLENDLSALSDGALATLLNKEVIVLDHQHYDWHDKASLVLSVGAFSESDGTVVSAEGRAGRFFAAYDKKYYLPTSDIKDSWRWLGAMANELDGIPHFAHLDEVIDELVAAYPELALIKEVAPNSDYRITGLKIAREPRRYSGRTSLRAKLSIHEPMQPKDRDSALTFSMEGYVGDKTPSSATPFAWSAGWNSPQAWNKFQETLGGKLKGGDVGIRLFDHLPRLNHSYGFVAMGKALGSSLSENRAKLVPIFNLFSSNALISSSPVVASQIKQASWTIGDEDAKAWGLKEGDLLEISQNDKAVILPVCLTDYLADGCIGYPAGQVLFVPYLPASVKKVESGEIFEPVYQRRVKAIEGQVMDSISLTNTGGLVHTFNNQSQQTSKPAVGVSR